MFLYFIYYTDPITGAVMTDRYKGGSWGRRNVIKTGIAVAAANLVGTASATEPESITLKGSYGSPLKNEEINNARNRVIDQSSKSGFTGERPSKIAINSDSAEIVSYTAVLASSGVIKQHVGLASTPRSVSSVHSETDTRREAFELPQFSTSSSSEWITNEYYTMTTEADKNGAIDSVHRFKRSSDDPDIFVMHDSKDWQPGCVRFDNSGTNEEGESKVQWGNGTDAEHEFEMVDYEPRNATGDYNVTLQASSDGSVSYGISRQIKDVEIKNQSIRDWNLTNHELYFQGEGRTSTDGFDPGSMSVLQSYSDEDWGLAVSSYMEGTFDRNWPYSEKTADHELKILM